MKNPVVRNENKMNASKNSALEAKALRLAMFSVHSCPVGELGTKDTGGMNVYIRELACELGKRGHRIDIFTRLHDPNDSQIIVLGENVRLIHLRAGYNGYMSKLAIYPYLPDFTSTLENFRKKESLHYDLVHSHYWLSGQIGRWAQDSWNVPHILMFHTLGAVKNATGVGEKEPGIRITFEKQLAKTTGRLIAATEQEKAELIRYYEALPERIGVVPCGVNLALFRPVDRVKARQKLGLGRDEKIMLYVGRFTPLKGIDRLLKTMTFLRNNGRPRLVIIGGDGHDTPEFKKLQKMTWDFGINDMIHFAGRVEQKDLPFYYSAADVLVVSSYHESFGLVALEALACGTPVVATDVGGMKRIIDEGKTGVVIKNNDPYPFARKISRFLSMSCDKAASAESTRASVLRFGWSNIADAIISEYWTALKDHSDGFNPIPSHTNL